MVAVLSLPPAAGRLEDLSANQPRFDPLDLLAGLDFADSGPTEPDVDQSPELASNRPDVSDLAAMWGRALAEFPFASTPAAVIPFAWPLTFPARGWGLYATAALEMLPPDLRYRIIDAGRRGMAAVIVDAAGDVREVAEHEFCHEPAAEVLTWPDEEDDTAERQRIYAGDELDAGKCRDVNKLAWVPTPAEIIAGAARERQSWTPEQFEAARGKRQTQLSQTAVFGSMTDRSLIGYGDD